MATKEIDALLAVKDSNGDVNIIYPATRQSNIIDFTGYKEYGIRIDKNNEDPESSVTYIGDAQYMSPGWDNWKNNALFKNIKPCILGDGGVVICYLDPTDWTKDIAGNAISLSEVDVMIEIPKIGYKITSDDNYVYVWLTTDYNADGYCYLAHSLDTEGDCDKIYVSAFDGYVKDEKLYSFYNVFPTVDTTLTDFRTYAENRGIGYQLISFYILTLLQCMYLVIYKNLNSQTALGMGNVKSTVKSSGSQINVGTLCYGTTESNVPVTFLGIENFYGNVFYWIDGVYCDENYNIKTTFNNFSDDGSDYPYIAATGLDDDIGGYLSDIVGTNYGGFCPTVCDGSSTTYYSDSAYLFCDYCAIFGGNWRNGVYAGAFRLCVDYDASESSSDLGGRLVYKRK
jgi:hypothetical protein